MTQEPVAETLGRGISAPVEDDPTLDSDGATTTEDGTTNDGGGAPAEGDDDTQGRGIS